MDTSKKIMRSSSHVKFIAFLFFFIFSVSFGMAYEKEPLYGLLVEGMDFSGKTAVCKALQKRLEEVGVKTEYNHCYLSNNFLIDFLFRKAIEFEGKEDEPYYYACLTVLDNLFFKKKNDVFYIQDRGWMSQECASKFSYSEKDVFFPKDYIVKNCDKFQFNVYLTLSYKTFKNRYEGREEDKALHEKLFYEDEDHFNKYQEFCLSKIPKDKGWLVINTDCSDLNKIVDQIFSYVNVK